MTTSTVSASIVTYNDRARVGDACNSLLEKTVRYAPKLYIIDNGSVDGTVQALKDFDVTIIENGSNLGFGAAHNKMLGAQMGKYHFFVNPVS